MDKTVNEYVAMDDRIVGNVITTSSSTTQFEKTAFGTEEECRMKELAEIHPLLPHWKIGITFLGKQKPVATSGADVTIADPTSESQDEDAKRVVANFPHHCEFALPMSGDEAKATHDANIRRKVQLHKSWQPRSVLMNTNSNIAALQAVSEFPPFVSTPVVAEPRPMQTNSDSGRPIPTVLLGSQRSDARANHENQRSETVTSDAIDNNPVGQNEET
ncbi:hypothetical protein FI667_g11156, partial [Globisporangium splendens]